MKHHDDLYEKLGAYLDGELEPRARAEVETLLAQSKEARAHLEELRRLHGGLLETPAPDPGEAYWSRFSNRVESRLARTPAASLYERLTAWFFPKGQASWWRAATAVATISVLGYVGVRGFKDVENRLLAPVTMDQGTPEEITAGTSDESGAPVGEHERPDSAPEAERPPDEVREVSIEPGLPSAAMRLKKEDPQSGEVSPRGAIPKRVSPRQGEDVEEALAGASAQSRPPALREEVPIADPSTAIDDKRAEARLQVQSRSRAEAVPPPPPAMPAPMATNFELSQKSPGGSGAVPDRSSRNAFELQAFTPTLSADAPRNPREEKILSFVAAALAEDVEGATREYTAFLALEGQAGDPIEAQPMRAWLQSRAALDTAGPEQKLLAGRQVQRSQPIHPPAEPGLQTLVALDQLVWPRRDDPNSRRSVEQIALRYEDLAQSKPDVRVSALRYLLWLAENTTDVSSSQRWREKYERLRE